MKKSIIISVAILLMLSSFSTEGMARTTAIHDSSIVIDEEIISVSDPLYVKDGRVFVPLRFMSESLGVEVNWHQSTRQVEMKTSIGDKIWFNIDNKIVEMNGNEYVMDVKPFISEGRTYLPLKHVAEILHTRVRWDNDHKISYLTTVPLYTVQPGDSVESISNDLNIAISQLKLTNHLNNTFLEIGQQIKVITPDFIDNPLNPEDLELLAKIIYLEAGYEQYEGQVAVGNVIMNRVEHSSFPNTIREVIYAPGQFTPVKNGKFEQAIPSDTAYKAARDAIGGKEFVGDALYFYNPKVSSHSFFASREYVATIGNHRFVK